VSSLATLFLDPPHSDPTAVRVGEPVTLGVPFPRGSLSDVGRLRLQNADGSDVPLQTRTLARWPDASVQWALLDFQANVAGAQTFCSLSVDAKPAPTPSTITVVESRGRITVDTGAAIFAIGCGDAFPFETVTVDGRHVVDPATCRLSVEDAAGVRSSMRIDDVQVVERGPLRAAVRVTGQLARPGSNALACSADLHFFARLPTSRVELTLGNLRRADHRGGFWDLGDPGSFLLRDASIELSLAEGGGSPIVRCSPEIGTDLRCCAPPVELYQDSSGGENWRSTVHVDRDRNVPHRFRGYRLVSTAESRSGLRATPVLTLEREGRVVAAAVEYFWQNFPRVLTAAADGLVIGLWPRQAAGLHELQGGERKTHVVHLAFGPDRVDATMLNWCRAPLFARADPEWYCRSGAVPYLLPHSEETEPFYRELFEESLTGANSFERKREAVDEYGWRHFGDIYADHEAAFHTGSAPLVSHYNNQYDAVAAFARQFLRSGDRRWWRMMCELAAHVCDIDIYHTAEDKAAYNGGMFWHTAHYVDAGTATHRTYSRATQTGSGGPSAEHNYPAGLMLHHFLTGDPRSRDSALGLARWVVDMDDGRRTVFRWLARGHTGHASASGSPDYHGPGRGGANSIRALIVGHRLSGDRRLLDKAEELIRRCINPTDSIEERRLLDAERRWFYTVFLQALGEYLDYKIELGELDSMYAYGRESLLAYADWMSRCERPYLDRPEALEFPNETWAAQDIRKSDVLLFAAKHARGDRRARFIERSRFFFDYAVSTLAATPHRTRTRPTVLALTNGFLQGFFLRHPDEEASAPGSPGDCPPPLRFEPQKAQARRRAVWAAMGAAILFAAGWGAGWR
jgi:exo-rhamnogalacturonan lyase-like protein